MKYPYSLSTKACTFILASSGIFGVGQTSITSIDEFLSGTIQTETSGGGVSRRRRFVDDEEADSYFGRKWAQICPQICIVFYYK